MSRQNPTSAPPQAPLFRPPDTPAPKRSDPHPIPSSSPAFSTPVHPIRNLVTHNSLPPPKPTILPILLPPPTLRPLAFRTFTKKYNLTLSSSALQVLATFIGKHCGTGWREEGLAERVLEEVARSWKKSGGGVIVEGDGEGLKGILRSLEGCMVGGKMVQSRGLSRENSFVFGGAADEARPVENPDASGQDDSQSSVQLSALAVADGDDEDEDHTNDPRRWLKVVGAFDQPRLTYNVGRKHFDRINTTPSLFPPPSHKTQLFRNRYNLVHQRLLRNESFQTPTVVSSRVPSLQRSSSSMATTQNSYKITQIANLLGRSGSSHLLLGLLAISPTGTLAITDLSGSIALDLQHAKPVPEDGAWFVPGMIVLADGVYQEEYNATEGALGGNGGVGGTIGGKFIAFSIGGPPCERREITVGAPSADSSRNASAGGGFGWVDFLGVGSERALGPRMRRIEQRVLGRVSTEPDETAGGRGKIVVLGEVNLDSPKTLGALKKIFGIYAAQPAHDAPMAIVLMGNFVQHAVMAGGGSGGSIEYKECFDSIASTLSEFPTLLQSTTFVFVPGDNDPWASAFSAGAATVLPKKGVPELFASRIKRAFAAANAETDRAGQKETPGEAIWTTNPSRMSLFGPSQEMVFFRDDMTSRLRRNALRFSTPEAEDDPTDPLTTPALEEATENMDLDPPPPASTPLAADLHTARKLTKTLLDQGHLSPFPLSTRPVLWDHAHSLSLYPLPTLLVLLDPEAPPFALTYEGCHVLNPGPVVRGRAGRIASWAEYDARERRGRVREVGF
ncbi:MAG: DNA-directed DNA polymerase epsilon, subunit B [Thelocarpon impressellum]|nr:MAG: DNA-directed DNA polymerase epsilon, subunit B [Thelocarpon impressellum]